MNRLIIFTLICFLLVPTGAIGKEKQCPYKDKLLTQVEFDKILQIHNEWVDEIEFESTLEFGEWVNFLAFNDDQRRAKLCGANLKNISLSKDLLMGADLSGANLEGLNLESKDFSHVDLSDAFMANTNLTSAGFYRTNLSNVDFSKSRMREALFIHSDLTAARMKEVDLSFSTFRDSDLSMVNLWRANLADVVFRNVDLSGARMHFAVLDNATIYEPMVGQLPDLPNMSLAKGLHKMTYLDSPSALVELRNAFRMNGFNEEDRQLTYAIKQRENAIPVLDEPKITNYLEKYFNKLLFEYTVKWGLEPGRALKILSFLVLVFWIPYAWVLYKPTSDGIWKHWHSDRARQDLGNNGPELLKLGFFSSLKYGFYFSLLSAFHFGWRDLNVGNWIMRIQTREFSLSATGWARALSGLQSLISLYLVAIWALSYFGKPFG